MKAVLDVVLAGAALLVVYVMVSQRERLAFEWRQTAVATAAFAAPAWLVGLVDGQPLRSPGRMASRSASPSLCIM